MCARKLAVVPVPVLANALLVLLVLLVLPLTAPSGALASPPKRPITHEDVWLMKRLGGQSLSPDGRWLVTSVAEPSYDHDTRVSDLWLTSTESPEPSRRLTTGRRGESDVAWSPDSSQLVFSTRREGDDVSQLYLLPVTRGGEAQRLTSLTLGARAPTFSPDGRHLAFVSDIWPGALNEADVAKLHQERKDRKFKARTYETFPIRHWDRWLDERRPTIMVLSLDGGEARHLLASSALIRKVGYSGRLGEDSTSLDVTFTPDGRGLVFVATDNLHEAARADVVHSLWHLALDGAEPLRLTQAEGSYASPTFTPDGTSIVARHSPSSKRWVFSADTLVRLPWPAVTSGTRATRIAPGFSDSISDFAIASDGRVFFLAEQQVRDALFVAPVDGGPPTEVGRLKAGTYSDLALAQSRGRVVLAAHWSSASSPAETGLIDLTSGAWRRLSSFNTERLADLDLSPVADFWFTSKRGHTIHSLVIFPPGVSPQSPPTARVPLFALIHGGPHSRFKDDFIVRWNYHLLAAPGYALVLPNFSGSTGYGEAFARRIQGDPLRGPADEINQAVDEALRLYPVLDPKRLAAGGASYGGHLANWLAVTTTRYKALVSHAGLFDLRSQWLTSDSVFFREKNLGGPAWDLANKVWRDQSPLYRADKLSTPMLVTFGEQDFRVPLNNGLELWTALQRQNVLSRLVLYPDENHWILKGENSRHFYGEIHAWLARFLALDSGLAPPPRGTPPP